MTKFDWIRQQCAITACPGSEIKDAKIKIWNK